MGAEAKSDPLPATSGGVSIQQALRIDDAMDAKLGAEAEAKRAASSEGLFREVKEKTEAKAQAVAEAKSGPKLNYVQRQEKRIRERVAAEAKAQEQARYAEAKNADEQYWDESAQQWAWTSTQYDAAGYKQSQYDTAGYEQSQFASQQPYDQSQFTYDEATQYHASQYEGGYDQSQYGAAAGFEQSFYTAPQHAGPEQSQYQSVYTAGPEQSEYGAAAEPSQFGAEQSVYTAGPDDVQSVYTAGPDDVAAEPSQFGFEQSVYTAGPEQSQYDTEFQSADYDPSTEHRLSTRGESRMSTYTEEPQSVELGPRCPDAYHGYFDTVRQEPYAYDEATGECVYAIDKDGAVFEADYRLVNWVRPYETSSIVAAPPERKPIPSMMVSYKPERAALIVQAAVRRQQAWTRTCEKVLKLYVKRLDEETAFYVYELANDDGGGTKPQWHRPAVLLGTRRRRGLVPYHRDCPDHSSDVLAQRDAQYDELTADLATLSPEHDGEPDRYAMRVPMDPALMLVGPFCARTGKGKKVRTAINKLPDSKGLRNHHSVDRKMPLFLRNEEVECADWKLGQWVQCFDGMVLKKVMVEPYMLSRGAGAQGPLEVVQLMQRNLKRPAVLYFCLSSIAKMELAESEMGLATKEASACVLQTLKTLSRFPKNEALVAAATGALVQLAQNYATREVILKEEWQRPVLTALNNLKKESKEHLITTIDGQEKVTVHTATRWACDISTNGCRVFGVMAADPKRREDLAEEAIKACLLVMAFCDESATVCSAACDCLYNYCYRCEFAAIAVHDQDAYKKVQEAVGNFMSDEHCQKQCERAVKVLAPDGWRGSDEVA